MLPPSPPSAASSRSPHSRSGYRDVDVPVFCVLTRFGLRRPRHLLPTYLDYRRVVKEASQAKSPGLLRSAFLIENSTTCYSLSIWKGTDAIPRFGAAVPEHVTAARRVFQRLMFLPGRGPELWSTKWQLTSTSNNLNWEDFDLRTLLQEVCD